jgi:hypothetical protein
VHPQPDAQGFLGRHRFVILFGTLLAFYVLVPIVHHAGDALHPATAPLVEGVFFIAVLAAAVVSVCRRRTAVIVAALWGLPLLGLWIADAVKGPSSLVVGHYVLAAAFFGFAIWMMLLFVFASRRVTFNTVCASLCVYLLMGVVWALFYSAVDVLSPGAFTWTVAGRSPPVLRIGKAIPRCSISVLPRSRRWATATSSPRPP